MNAARNFAIAWIALVLVAGCAWLGLAQPETFEERVAAGYGLATGARQGAMTLLAAGVIRADDAQNVQQQADLGREGIEIARRLQPGNPAAAATRLQATLVALKALQAYLESRKPPEATPL